MQLGQKECQKLGKALCLQSEMIEQISYIEKSFLWMTLINADANSFTLEILYNIILFCTKFYIIINNANERRIW